MKNLEKTIVMTLEKTETQAFRAYSGNHLPEVFN